MNALLVLLLMQAPVEDSVGAFLKGDAAARDALLKAGAAAILPLQKARDKAPEKIDALVFELKKAAAWPQGSAGPELLERKQTFEYRGENVRKSLADLQLRCELNLICDRFQPADLKSDKITVDSGEIPSRQALDMLCRQAGLDYGFFHNAIVVGKSERLWGDGKGVRAFGPPAMERQHKNPDEEKLLKNLTSIKLNLDFQNSNVSTAMTYVKEICGIEIEVDGEVEKAGMDIRIKDLRAFEVICLLTQSRDLDFIISGGTVVIDTREAIAKKIAAKK